MDTITFQKLKDAIKQILNKITEIETPANNMQNSTTNIKTFNNFISYRNYWKGMNLTDGHNYLTKKSDYLYTGILNFNMLAYKKFNFSIKGIHNITLKRVLPATTSLFVYGFLFNITLKDGDDHVLASKDIIYKSSSGFTFAATTTYTIKYSSTNSSLITGYPVAYNEEFTESNRDYGIYTPFRFNSTLSYEVKIVGYYDNNSYNNPLPLTGLIYDQYNGANTTYIVTDYTIEGLTK